MSWLSSVFGGHGSGMPTQNPASSAMPYLDQIRGEYTNPDTYNQIVGQYKESPGFKMLLQRALDAQGKAAAAGGMSGSMQHQMLNESTATDLSSQDFHKYLADRLGISQDMASVLGKKAEYGYSGQASMNSANAENSKNHTANLMSLLGLLGGGALGAYGGGPLGFLFGAQSGGSWFK